MRDTDTVLNDYAKAKSRYKSLDVDTDRAIGILKEIPLSIHCWQGNDVMGLESDGELTGGIMATGNYAGRARTGDELRQDIDKAFSLIPGKKKLNLHAMYAEFYGVKAERDAIDASHFTKWIEWAKRNGYGLDFNPTLFSHQMFRDNMSLTHSDKKIVKFWVEHCKRTREIGSEFGKQLGTPCVNNIWVADGMKDTPAQRLMFRQRLKDALDEIFEVKYLKSCLVDSVESKLFGIGTESFVPGSFEFYLGYAIKNNLTLCLDSGHFHPTETIADKISSVLLYIDNILLHVSRGIRWDSDHVAALSDDTKMIARECIVSGINRVFCALDYFDASINRIAAWVIGARAFLKALLIALLEPEIIRDAEEKMDYTMRFALMEEIKQLPWGAVWDRFCIECGVPAGFDWMEEIRTYETDILKKR